VSAPAPIPSVPAPPRRLGIFLAYDAEGILDDYIFHLLREIRPSLARLIIMVNGRLTDESLAKLRDSCDDIHLRPNQGFDVGAWREGILTHCGLDHLRHYDELVLFNDSFFGPFRPFPEIFKEMAGRNVDFWGLSVHGEVTGMGLCPYGYRPRYLQTYFLVFGKRMLLDPAFLSFWENLPEFRHFDEVSERFSAVLTRHFADLGYAWAACCDTADLETDREHAVDPHTFHLFEMIAHRRFPVIKRRSFLVSREHYLRWGNGHQLRDALNDVHNLGTYDLNLIFAHLLRKYGAGLLGDCLGLNVILPSGDPPHSPAPAGRPMLVVAHLSDPTLFPFCSRYLKNVPPEADVIVTTDTPEKRNQLERLLAGEPGRRLTVRQVDPRGRHWSALLSGCRDRLTDYAYLGFVHDGPTLHHRETAVGAPFRDRRWDNMLANEDYVRRIGATFDATPWLGLLVPPTPIHATLFPPGRDPRPAPRPDAIVGLAEKIDLPPRLLRNRPPIAAGSFFWCRTDALNALLAAEWRDEEFPSEPLASDGTLLHALDTILPYAAQARGYLSGWVMTDRHASGEMANLRYMLEETRRALNGTPGVRLTSFDAFRRSLTTLRRLLRLTGLRGPLALLEQAGRLARRRCPRRIRKWVTQLRLLLADPRSHGESP